MAEAAVRGQTAPLGPMFANQLRAELLAIVRVPAFGVLSLALPIVFFTFIGLPQSHQQLLGTTGGAYLLASFAAYGVSSLMLFSFGIGVAAKRAQKVDVLARAMPLPPWVALGAQVVSAASFSVVTLAALFSYAWLVGGVRLAPASYLDLGWRLVAGGVPFIGLGFAIGYLSGPNTAPAAVNIIYLPLAFASGIFIPVRFLPDFVQRIAPYLPTYRYGQLAWQAAGAHTDPLAVNVAYLAGYSVLFFLLAGWAYRRDSRRKFA